MPLIPSAGGGRHEILNVVKFIIRTRTSVGTAVGAIKYNNHKKSFYNNEFQLFKTFKITFLWT